MQRAETFKEFMKFLQIRERFTNFLPREKLFVEATKNMLKEQRTSRCSHKIGPTNRSEALIELRKDEECAEKAKYFQLSDQDESNNNYQIKKRCACFNRQRFSIPKESLFAKT